MTILVNPSYYWCSISFERYYKVFKFKRVQEFINTNMHYAQVLSLEALSELHRSQECGHNIRDDSRQHHLHRAKICSKIIKYPNVEDYTVCIPLLTEKKTDPEFSLDCTGGT